MQHNELIQRSDEWLAWRQDKIGSSDAATIMGINRYKTAFELYMEKKGLIKPQGTTYPMARGTALEPLALAWYKEYTGLEMFPTVEVHPEFSYLIASMDGVNFSGTKGLEIKCPMGKKPEQIARDGIPDEYYCQIQHQMLVTGLNTIDLLVFDGSEGAIYPVTRDHEYIGLLLSKEQEFYQLLLNDTPPIPTQLKPIKDDSYESIESPEWADLASTLRESNERLRAEKELNDDLRDRAKELSAGKSVRGFGMSLRVSSIKGAVDYAKVPELLGVNLEQYRKSATTRILIDFD